MWFHSKSESSPAEPGSAFTNPESAFLNLARVFSNLESAFPNRDRHFPNPESAFLNWDRVFANPESVFLNPDRVFANSGFAETGFSESWFDQFMVQRMTNWQGQFVQDSSEAGISFRLYIFLGCRNCPKGLNSGTIRTGRVLPKKGACNGKKGFENDGNAWYIADIRVNDGLPHEGQVEGGSNGK